MAVIGDATLNIVPKVVGGLASAINAEIDGASLGDAGKRAGSGFMSGFTSGASFGAWSELASKAINVVTDSLGSAAARVDTLNNYPRVMEQLGVSTEEANSSISTMSAALSNVPTRLDDMASTTQGLYAATKKYGTSLTTVTDAGLALNSMLLAGGQSTGIVNAAMEQFRQMVSKGKPELQDWRSMLQAAPGQMEQLAEAMLGAGKTADDLYKALGGGQRGQAGIDFTPELSMDKFIEKFAQMKGKFADAAEEAQGGIQTSLANMQNAVTRGVAGVMDAIGQENIASAINVVKSLINDAFGFVNAIARDIAPVAGGIINSVKDVIDGVHEMRDRLNDGFRYGFDGLDEGKGKIADLNDAISQISGLNDGAATGFSSLSDTIDWAMGRASDSAKRAKDAHDDYLTTVVNAADSIREAYAAYEGDSHRLDSISEAIEKYGNKADTTAGQQWELKRAIEELNDMCGTHYGVLEDGYTIIDTETGKVQENTKAIQGNIEMRRYAAKAEAIGAALAEEQKVYDAAAAYYAEQKKANEDALAAMDLLIEKYGSLERVEAIAKNALGRSQTGDMSESEVKIVEICQAWAEASKTMQDATNKMHDAENAVSSLSSQGAALESLAKGGEQNFHDLAAASGVAAEAIGTNGGAALETFATTIQQMGDSAQVNGEKLKGALGDPQQMAEIVAAYDGTAASLQGVFEQMGLGWDATAAKSIDAQNGIVMLRDAFGGLAESSQVMQAIGGNADELAVHLSNMGITSSDLAQIGADNFAALAAACGGNIDAMVAAIAGYNSQTIQEKDGKVVVNVEGLEQALAKEYEFNEKGDLTDKNGKVLVNKSQLDDAYEAMLKYNDKDLDKKLAEVSANDGGLPQVNRDLDYFIGLPDRTEKTTSVTNERNEVVNYITNGSPNAAGGHIEPKHAGGFIAAGATRTPYGIVGENGVEAAWINDNGSMDVYPLNNPRYLNYAKPLADSIAGHIMGAMGTGAGTQVNVYLDYDAGASPREMAAGIADELALVFDARGW